MNDMIWQTAAGGLLCAARALEPRCGVTMPPGPELSGLAADCLDAANALTSRGKSPGAGLETLASVFDHLGARPLEHGVREPWRAMSGSWQAACPLGAFGETLDRASLAAAAAELKQQLEPALAAGDYAALERSCENTLSFLPAFPGDREDGDLSLYVYGRMTAALAGCFALLAEENGGLPERKALFSRKTLLLFSCDFSGIQRFIYLISTKSALKMLRSRSFYLELVMENLIDELVEGCGLTRANCIYAGGGHAYVLLPNTAQVRGAVQNFDTGINAWLQAQFGVSLYLACGMQPCSPDALFCRAGAEAYSDVFRSLSAKLGHRKLTRCDAAALRRLNRPGQTGRECRVCGRTPAGKNDLCPWCGRFSRLGGLLLEPDLVFAVTDCPPEHGFFLPLPGAAGERYARLVSREQAACLDHPRRMYCKNGEPGPLPRCRRLWVGDHCPSSLLEDLTKQSKGIQRMGIFRADVDNLGKAFISGYAAQGGGTGYLSLERASAFSHSLSAFFKRYINQLLAPFSGVLVVYSGGDDLFLAGGWSDLLEAAQTLRRAFDQFTNGRLTFSGGFGLYTDHYPVARAAQETAGLEDFSKQLPQKNAITLFDAEASLRFSWPVFESQVMGEKYRLLDAFFQQNPSQKKDQAEAQRGNAFLYRLLDYLRQSDDRLNLARCAYLLTRLQPSEDSSAQRKEAYRVFSQRFYNWALEPEGRRQLIAAIYLYVYFHREQDIPTSKED